MAKKAKQAGLRVQGADELAEAAREVIAEADALLSSKAPTTDRFRAAVEKLRGLVADDETAPSKHATPKEPLSQQDWDERVLAWALTLDTPITVDRAFAALAPDAPTGSSEQRAIAASLKRLPRDRFTVSWYMANTALAPVWTKQSK